MFPIPTSHTEVGIFFVGDKIDFTDPIQYNPNINQP